MATFNSLAVELQEAIWDLVLPHRGVHWIQVEGLLKPASYIRDSIRFTRAYNFGENLPQTLLEIISSRGKVPEHTDRWTEELGDTGSFFKKLLTTVPTVWGMSGSNSSEEEEDAEDVAYARRCRQLSTYTQVAVLLSTCRLSRLVALGYIHHKRQYSWQLCRGMGPLYRPRPMDVWESQYQGNNEPDVPDRIAARGCAKEVLLPNIYMLDLAVFRLHDSQGRPTQMLRHGPWQYNFRHGCGDITYANFNRVAIEWHPRWATSTGREDFCAGNVEQFIRLMDLTPCLTTHLYWLVDGIPRPNWKQDYPALIKTVFEEAIANNFLNKYFLEQWGDLGDKDERRKLADLGLHQEFEANGRRYYIVFLLIPPRDLSLEQRLDEAGLSFEGPFPGGEDMWPELLRAPVKFAHHAGNMGTLPNVSYVLSWEPI